MAYTNVAAIVVPSVYLPYEYELTAELSKFWNSGIIVPDPVISDKLNGGGQIFDTPIRKLDDTDPEDLQTGSVITTRAGTTAEQKVRRLVFGMGWSEEDLAGVLSGSKPEYELPAHTAAYWGRKYEKVLVNMIRGVIANNIAADSSDLVNDIGHATDGALGTASNWMSADAVVDTALKHGDRADKFEGGGMACHSTVYTRLLKLDMIDFIPDSKHPFGIPTYKTMTVIVDDNLPAIAVGSGYDYWTILFESGCVGFGEGGYRPVSRLIPIETDRTVASGIDMLYMRKCFALNVKGFSFISGSVAGENPTLAELYAAANWDRVLEKKNCGISVLITNG